MGKGSGAKPLITRSVGDESLLSSLHVCAGCLYRLRDLTAYSAWIKSQQGVQGVVLSDCCGLASSDSGLVETGKLDFCLYSSSSRDSSRHCCQCLTKVHQK